MLDASFDAPDLTTFCRLDELGLVATGQLVEPGGTVIECRVVAPDEFCRRCGAECCPRGSVVRGVAHRPFSDSTRRPVR